MIKAGEKIERLYAHWFDMVIENEDLNSAFEQLVKFSLRNSILLPKLF